MRPSTRFEVFKRDGFTWCDRGKGARTLDSIPEENRKIGGHRG